MRAAAAGVTADDGGRVTGTDRTQRRISGAASRVRPTAAAAVAGWARVRRGGGALWHTRGVKPKPAHLGKTYAEQFTDPSVVEAYRRRPAYPDETFLFLRSLVPDGRGCVLDVGCGRGNLTLPMASWAKRIDALDPSAGMLTEARRAAGGKASNIRWIHGTLEDAPLEGDYDLATAGESLHWTEWAVTLPRLARLLRPGARLALVQRSFSSPPWDEELLALIPRYSTSQAYQPYELVDELAGRGLFELEQCHDVPGRAFSQTVDDYVESFHSANGFSRDRMSKRSGSRVRWRDPALGPEEWNGGERNAAGRRAYPGGVAAESDLLEGLARPNRERAQPGPAPGLGDSPAADREVAER